MKIGIYDLNECSSLGYKERLDIYKSVGFTGVGTYIDDNYMANNESYVDIIEYAKKIGLEVNQVHVDYKISNLICEDSNAYFDYVERKLKECIDLGVKYMVLHASKGDAAPILSEEGLTKLKELMSKYRDSGVTLSFENVRDNRNLDKILNAGIEGVGMCYDLGHAHCYDNEEFLLNRYCDKVVCTHLHNNYKKDTHYTLFNGEIDCKKIIKKISDSVDNCLEVFPERGVVLDNQQFTSFVKENYEDYLKCKEE